MMIFKLSFSWELDDHVFLILKLVVNQFVVMKQLLYDAYVVLLQGGGYRDRREKGNWGDRRDRRDQNIHRRGDRD